MLFATNKSATCNSSETPLPQQSHCQGQSQFQDTTFVTNVIKDVNTTRAHVSSRWKNKEGSKKLYEEVAT